MEKGLVLLHPVFPPDHAGMNPNLLVCRALGMQGVSTTTKRRRVHSLLHVQHLGENMIFHPLWWGLSICLAADGESPVFKLPNADRLRLSGRRVQGVAVAAATDGTRTVVTGPAGARRNVSRGNGWIEASSMSPGGGGFAQAFASGTGGGMRMPPSAQSLATAIFGADLFDAFFNFRALEAKRKAAQDRRGLDLGKGDARAALETSERNGQGSRKLSVVDDEGVRKFRGKRIEKMPQVVLMFLTRTGLVNPQVWQRYFDDFNEYLVETYNIKKEHLEPKKHRFLRSTTHFRKRNTGARGTAPTELSLVSTEQADLAPAAEKPEDSERYKEVLEVTPDWMKPFVTPNPVPTQWGRLLRGMSYLVNVSLDYHPEADYFIYVSDTTIPVKPFWQIWHEIHADPRSRFDTFCPHHFNGVPKHSQWIMLSRAHALRLAEGGKDEPVGVNADDKTPRPWWEIDVVWPAGDCLSAASDEYYPAKHIAWNGGVEDSRDAKSEDEDDSIFEKEESPEEPIDRFNRTVIQCGGDETSSTLEWFTFVDWATYKESTWGQKARPGAYPSEFRGLNGAVLYHLIHKPRTWFMRKVTPEGNDEVAVHGCEVDNVMFLMLASQSEMPLGKRSLSGKPFTAKATDFHEQRLSRFREGLNTTSCSLSEFMSRQWKFLRPPSSSRPVTNSAT